MLEDTDRPDIYISQPSRLTQLTYTNYDYTTLNNFHYKIGCLLFNDGTNTVAESFLIIVKLK